jgi:hypothetical protein
MIHETVRIFRCVSIQDGENTKQKLDKVLAESDKGFAAVYDKHMWRL